MNTTTMNTTTMNTIGIYNCYTGVPAEAIPFFQACGYNTYQRWDLGWTIWPEKHTAYYEEMVEDMKRMRAAGFRVYILLNINMRQCPSGGQEGYLDAGFAPADQEAMAERLGYLSNTITKLADADGFTIFAGDPGGHATATPEDALLGTRSLIEMVTRLAPRAEINLNTWGIAAWDHFTSPFDVAFWDKEVTLTRDFHAQSQQLKPGLGLEFPLHNYYRSLALSCYEQARREPPLYPCADEIRNYHQNGASRLWGWPYFLTDECDDGYRPGTAGQAQGETRYLKQIIDTGRELGLNGMIANAFAQNILAESLNLYAFARFCQAPGATPESVINEFAGCLATPESAGELAAVLRFLENRSTWTLGLPSARRLPEFTETPLASVEDAGRRLERVTLRNPCPLPLAGAPEVYLEKLRERLLLLASAPAT